MVNTIAFKFTFLVLQMILGFFPVAAPFYTLDHKA